MSERENNTCNQHQKFEGSSSEVYKFKAIKQEINMCLITQVHTLLVNYLLMLYFISYF